MPTFYFKGFDGLPEEQASAAHKVGGGAAANSAACEVQSLGGSGAGAIGRGWR